MTDQELLEMAAKAAGIEGDYSQKIGAIVAPDQYWMPHKDDGDALRLAVKLSLKIIVNGMFVHCDTDNSKYDIGFFEENSARNDGDIMKAVRLSIVRAAAGIGESMEKSQ